ncbi:MAG TPA: hypothetical protein EYH20_05940 [Leucothrix sp.]|nr:hypothetical protein [Leucothrix sp.]
MKSSKNSFFKIKPRYFLLSSLYWVILFNTIWLNTANADQFNQASKYHELIFQAEFSSDYPSYPHSGNKQRGTIYAYQKHADTSAKKRFKSLSSQSIKQMVLADSTPNPFRKIYAYLYTQENRAKLLKCPALSFPFELDSDASTKEWVVSSSPYLCLTSRGFDLDSIPHIWILQRQAGKYRVLMEADGYIKIFGKSQNNYNDILAYIYQTRVELKPAVDCGGPMNMWTYQNNTYQLANADYHAQDCDYKNTSGNAWVSLNKKYIQAVKPSAQKLMEKLKQNQAITSSRSISTNAPAATGLEDIMSTEDLIKLLK